MGVISNKTVEELLGHQGSFLALILYYPEREAQMTYGIREGEPHTLKKHASPLTDSFRLLMSGRGSNRAMLTRKRALKHPPPSPLNSHKSFCIKKFTGRK